MKVFDLINYDNKLSYNGYDAVFKKVFIWLYVVLYVTYFKRKIMMQHLIFLVGMYEISDGHVDIKIYRL